MFEKFLFWWWHKGIEFRTRKNPAVAFMWKLRVMFVYKPLFETKEFKAVLEEHKKHLNKLNRKYNDTTRTTNKNH